MFNVTVKLLPEPTAVNVYVAAGQPEQDAPFVVAVMISARAARRSTPKRQNPPKLEEPRSHFVASLSSYWTFEAKSVVRQFTQLTLGRHKRTDSPAW